MEIINNTEIGEISKFIAEKILEKLKQDKKVLYFVTGGSSIPIAVKTADIISQNPHSNLTIMLTDERYGPLGHKDSNWQKILDLGFKLPEAKLIPILNGESRENTNLEFQENIKTEIEKADYKIAIFGIGTDGHTAGILPESDAVNTTKLTYEYSTELFERITITPKTIETLDEAIVFMKGEEKWKVLEELKNQNIEILHQPAQILKKVPLLTIFTDYKN